MKRIIFLAAAIITLVNFSASADDRLNIAAICYHSVTDNPLTLSTYRISDNELREDLEYFTELGYTFLKPSEMWYAHPGKNMVLTFDDGYDDFYDVVFPLLQEYNAKAVVYLIGSEIDKTGYLKSWQIKELDASGLVEIGNHTTAVHNYGWTYDDYVSDDLKVNEIIEDVKDCSSRVYNILGHGTESFAYPSGQYTYRIDNILKENLGYTTTFTTTHGIVKYQSDIASPMKRIYRIHGDTPQKIESMINACK
ncbi:MAG: polysaccharide deacetylase family protein [bacterium]|nr:polysaccharide deacetylase family protein [bacterium]